MGASWRTASIHTHSATSCVGGAVNQRTCCDVRADEGTLRRGESLGA